MEKASTSTRRSCWRDRQHHPQAHPSDDITEQEALDQLAALSVLARWVDESDVDIVADGGAGEQPALARG